ncbi:glycosyltransferase [uncultured Aquimarina sp.]|uniref:glycosyltransferase family 2 protein n=1 Tax=uncultured Aquimarina sp. TaxID=575652 RepID=UPI00262ADE12|nr:glycosyltransferase [uncultured Aquimarina sp.]
MKKKGKLLLKEEYYKTIKKKSAERSLIHKKFVGWRELFIVFILSMLFLIFYSSLLKNTSLYFSIFIQFLLSILVWYKMYQILYDLKLLFFFNNQYDIDIACIQTDEFPPIAFIIPSYNEPFDVGKMTFDSIVSAPYPGRKEIIVVDNSSNIKTEDLIKWKSYVMHFSQKNPNLNLNSIFLYNEQRDTLKPGNLDLAQRFIEESEFVVILDVDSTLPSKENLLERAVIEFKADSKIGFLQFRSIPTNIGFNQLTEAIAKTQELHRLRMTSRGYGGFKIFEGHNGIWRKSVLDKTGQWTDYYKNNIMITEDFLKSSQTYAGGYYGKSLNINTGEWIPSSLKSLESMWMRWTYGNAQVLFKYIRNIYSNKITLIEKFDISYHLLGDIATGIFFVLIFLTQLFFQGAATNFLIISLFIIPQLICAVTSYFTTVSKQEIPIMKKMQHLYSAFFLIDTFIMTTKLKSGINFMLGISQGWKVTEKGVENKINWVELIYNNWFHILIAFSTIIICIISWVKNYEMKAYAVIYHFFSLFLSINLILCIFIYGKHRRKEHNNVKSAGIDQI